jgi:four helix bundle protein
MQGHRDLIAWQKAMELVTAIYKVSRTWPDDERYGLTAQIRRAAVSVPSNLAEGHGRNSRGEFHHFIGQARGSLLEVETQLEIARNLGYLKAETADQLIQKTTELGRIITGLRDWSEAQRAGANS